MNTTLENAKRSEKWSISDVNVDFDSHWWGFEIHLNEAATKLLGQIDKWAGTLVTALGEEIKPIADTIVAYIKLRQAVIQAEDKGTGVKLVSPWSMPTLLVPLPDPTHIDDSQLCWTTTDGQNGWVAEQKMNSAFSETGPALAVFQDKLFCVYKGGGDNQNLYYMSFDGQWTDPQPISNATSTDTPALAVFQGKLFCVYKGGGDNQHLYWMFFDGNRWNASGSNTIPNADSHNGPALAVFQDKLYGVYRGGGSNQHLYWLSFDGNSWNAGGSNQISGADSQCGPALAVFRGKLFGVHRGGGSNQNLYWLSFDGNRWSAGGSNQIQSAVSPDGAALAVFQDKLCCLYRGGDSNQHIYHMESSDGMNWNASGSNTIPDVNSYYQPGLTVYRHPKGTREQLLCVHRGVKS